MDSVLAEKDPIALEGLTVALEAVDVILKSLLDEIQIRSRAIDDSDPFTAMPKLMRLLIQKQTIKTLRQGIPAAIIYGDPTKLRGAVG